MTVVKALPTAGALSLPKISASELKDVERLAAAKARTAMPEIPRPLVDRHRHLPNGPALKALEDSLLDGAAPVGRRLLERISMGWNLFEQERIAEIGLDAYLEEQLYPEAIDDQGLEAALEEALPSLAMTPYERVVTYYEEPEIPIVELLVATVLRSVYTPRQLLERMTVLWRDHFNVLFYSALGIWLFPNDHREVIRRHAMGTFPELLGASARSPAMLSYLTNDSNVREHPNENYARELLELHALGVDGGYTEHDVKEVARCFTGWTFWPPRAGVAFGTFRFDPRVHDFGPKTVLGQPIAGDGGIADGEAVLEILATHPSTARFVAGKLLRHFWGYEPPAKMVDRVADTYLATGGDVRSMLRQVLDPKWLAVADTKLKRPYHLIVSGIRALFAELENPFFVLRAAELSGHLPFAWAPPNGYPDSAGYWAGNLLPRWNFGSLALTFEEAGVRIDLPFLDPSRPAAELAFLIDLLLTGGTLSPETRGTVEAFLGAAPVTERRIREAIGLVLAGPEFQEY